MFEASPAGKEQKRKEEEVAKKKRKQGARAITALWRKNNSDSCCGLFTVAEIAGVKVREYDPLFKKSKSQETEISQLRKELDQTNAQLKTIRICLIQAERREVERRRNAEERERKQRDVEGAQAQCSVSTKKQIVG